MGGGVRGGGLLSLPVPLSLIISLSLFLSLSLPRMSEWSMNAYLYAPKDDVKHRACWRDLYSLEEANQLSHLIHEATSKGVVFIYAIAPGLIAAMHVLGIASTYM